MKTLTGINSAFTYIVSPEGEVMFRKFPCFCENCYNRDVHNCKHADLVGKVRVVVSAGENIRKDILLSNDIF